MQKKIFCLLALFFCAAAHADFVSLDEAGLGYSDNPYFTSTDVKPDFFFRVRSRNTWTLSDHKTLFDATYTGFFKETPNDVFNWRVADERNLRLFNLPWQLNTAFFGNHYIHNSPGTTDDGFSNIGAEADFQRKWQVRPNLLLTYGPGLELDDYIDISRRTDTLISMQGNLDYTRSKRLDIYGASQLDMVLSTDSDFSKTFLELDGGCSYAWSPVWTWYNDVTLRETEFFSRTVSRPTILTTRRGETINSTSTAYESYTTWYWATEVRRDLSKEVYSSLRLTASNQNSTSGLLDYSTFGIYARLVYMM